MLYFLEKLPNIYLLWMGFGLSLVVYLYTREERIFQVVVTFAGAVIGIAMKTAKPEQTINAENIEKADLKQDASDTL